MKKLQPRHKPIHSGWILYDDSCGLCRRLARFWQKRLLKHGLGIAALQSPWVKQKTGLSQWTLKKDLHLLLDNGEIIKGADTYRYALRYLPWARPVSFFANAPLGRQIFNWSYRKLADNRHRFSGACETPEPSEKTANHRIPEVEVGK